MVIYLGTKNSLKKTKFNKFADVAELADALDLGSSDFIVGVQVPSPAPKKNDYFDTIIVLLFLP